MHVWGIFLLINCKQNHKKRNSWEMLTIKNTFILPINSAHTVTSSYGVIYILDCKTYWCHLRHNRHLFNVDFAYTECLVTTWSYLRIFRIWLSTTNQEKNLTGHVSENSCLPASRHCKYALKTLLLSLFPAIHHRVCHSICHSSISYEPFSTNLIMLDQGGIKCKKNLFYKKLTMHPLLHYNFNKTHVCVWCFSFLFYHFNGHHF